MRTTTYKRTVTLVKGLPTITRVIYRVNFINGQAYGFITVNRMERIVKADHTCEQLHWSKDTWTLNDVRLEAI